MPSANKKIVALVLLIPLALSISSAVVVYFSNIPISTRRIVLFVLAAAAALILATIVLLLVLSRRSEQESEFEEKLKQQSEQPKEASEKSQKQTGQPQEPKKTQPKKETKGKLGKYQKFVAEQDILSRLSEELNRKIKKAQMRIM